MLSEFSDYLEGVARDLHVFLFPSTLEILASWVCESQTKSRWRCKPFPIFAEFPKWLYRAVGCAGKLQSVSQRSVWGSLGKVRTLCLPCFTGTQPNLGQTQDLCCAYMLICSKAVPDGHAQWKGVVEDVPMGNILGWTWALETWMACEGKSCACISKLFLSSFYSFTPPCFPHLLCTPSPTLSKTPPPFQ